MLIKSPIIQKKKQELKFLEKKYQDLVYKRDELLREIEEFNNEYNLKFSKLLDEILNLKEENIYKKIELYKLKKEKLLKDENILKNLEEKRYKIQAEIDKIKHNIKLDNATQEDKIRLEELKIALSEVESQIEFINKEKDLLQRESFEKLEEELDEAKSDKEEFYEEIKEIQKIDKLDDNQKIELKKLYRKISKLIHPDVVDENNKKEASNIMAKVNELYRLHKLDELKKMLIEIEHKNFIFNSDMIDEEDILQQEIYRMKDKIVELQKEIDELQANEIFEIIENKEEYFIQTKENLERRLADLKAERSYIDINIAKYLDF